MTLRARCPLDVHTQIQFGRVLVPLAQTALLSLVPAHSSGVPFFKEISGSLLSAPGARFLTPTPCVQLWMWVLNLSWPSVEGSHSSSHHPSFARAIPTLEGERVRDCRTVLDYILILLSLSLYPPSLHSEYVWKWFKSLLLHEACDS